MESEPRVNQYQSVRNTERPVLKLSLAVSYSNRDTLHKGRTAKVGWDGASAAWERCWCRGEGLYSRGKGRTEVRLERQGRSLA